MRLCIIFLVIIPIPINDIMNLFEFEKIIPKSFEIHYPTPPNPSPFIYRNTKA